MAIGRNVLLFFEIWLKTIFGYDLLAVCTFEIAIDLNRLETYCRSDWHN